MLDTLYFNVHSILKDKTVKCEIPAYNFETNEYNTTTVIGKVDKQYSNPILPSICIDIIDINGNKHTVNPCDITTINGVDCVKFAKSHGFKETGESLEEKVGRGRPRTKRFTMAELMQLAAKDNTINVEDDDDDMWDDE